MGSSISIRLSKQNILMCMNCNKISEAHVWRYSKHNKTRRCVKCKSKVKLTQAEFDSKWGKSGIIVQ